MSRVLLIGDDEALNRVWDYGYVGDSRIVDAAAGRLRAKVEPDPASPALLRAVRGVKP